jgi:hypothetical protein
MPYIKQENRPKFKNKAKELGQLAEVAGDLNYIITEMVHEFIKKKGKNYANLNEVMGALECCKLELYRKIAAPYEDDKIKENGDVGLLEGKSPDAGQVHQVPIVDVERIMRGDKY